MSLCTILLLQLGELSTEARVWDHQRFRFFGRGGTLEDVESLGVMDVCEDDFGREFVMPFIERTWTYFFFIFLVAAILKFEDLWVVG